jgi:hypothetical protein
MNPNYNQNGQNGQNGLNERLQACQALAGVLDLGDELDANNFNNQSGLFSEELQQREFEGGVGLPQPETDALFVVCQDIQNSLTSWNHFHNAWANNRRALIDFMLASPAFDLIHEQLLDEE